MAIAQTLGMKGRAVIVNGENFPDALRLVAIAARQGEPVLPTPAAGMPDSINSELRLLSVTQTTIAGGQGVVPPAVLGSLPAGTRLAGGDRYGTAAAILQAYPPSGQTVYLATGENFPDALSGGILAALQGADIMLVPPGGPTSAERAMLKSWQGKKIVALGGSGVISDAVLQEFHP